MAMTRFEKRFVNRKKKAEGNVEKIRKQLDILEIKSFHDALEIGCGIGSVSAFLANSYQMNVWGTDFDSEQINSAKILYPETERLRYQVEDASDLSFEDNSFDLIVSQNTFHHIPNWREAVKEIARVLKSRGYFLWFDLAFPMYIKKIFQPFVKNYALYTFEEVKREFAIYNFETLFYEHRFHGLFIHHNLILQR